MDEAFGQAAVVIALLECMVIMWMIKRWNEATVEIRSLQRRLADVEAIRKREIGIDEIKTPDHTVRIDHLLEVVEVDGLAFSLALLGGDLITPEGRWIRVERGDNGLIVHQRDERACSFADPEAADIIRTHLGEPPFGADAFDHEADHATHQD